MATAAHSSAPNTARPTANERWSESFRTLADQAKRTAANEDRTILLLARSPQTPAASKVLRNIKALTEDGITVTCIFAEFPKRGAGAKLLSSLAAEYGEQDLARYVRQLTLSGWKSLNERVQLGRVALYSGPKLEIVENDLQAETLVDIRNQPDRSEDGRMSFARIWACSQPLDARSCAYYSLDH
ncbi:MAG: hypothetical protein AAFQ22_01445 [Pseudomonadota bacterium]